MERPIIVVGVARSATTWLAHTTAALVGTRFVDEPDGHAKHPRGLVAKAGRGIFPTAAHFDGPLARYWLELLNPGAAPKHSRRSAAHATALAFWNRTTGEQRDFLVSGRPTARLLARIATPVLKAVPAPRPAASGKRLVIKSVHACLYAHRLHEVAPEAHIVATRRPLIETAASWLRLEYLPFEQERVEEVILGCRRVGIEPPPWPESDLDRMVWTVGIQDAMLTSSAERLRWPVFDHARATDGPRAEFARLSRLIGIGDISGLDELLSSSNEAGATYEPRRRPETVGQWATGLDPHAAERLLASVAKFSRDIGDRR